MSKDLSTEDKVLIGLLRLSLEHAASVIELSSLVTGTMQYRKKSNSEKVIKEFRKLHKNYQDNYQQLIEELSGKIEKNET